jgi:hypothetical protein
MHHPVQNVAKRAAALEKCWSPQHILTLNSSHSLKVAKIKGEFIWHSHPDTDEVFLLSFRRTDVSGVMHDGKDGEGR